LTVLRDVEVPQGGNGKSVSEMGLTRLGTESRNDHTFTACEFVITRI
jgi:hypothetical protein